MKPEELRIGNFVEYEGQIVKWKRTDFVDNTWVRISKPIQLTEEWLIKFGLKGMHSKKLTKGIKIASYGNGEYQIYVATEMHAITTEDLGAIRIKYVHSLQNLYFALTGKELTIKELTE